MDLFKLECDNCECDYLGVATGEEISIGIASHECPSCGNRTPITNETHFVSELKKEEPKGVNAEIKVKADVFLNEEIMKNAEKQYGMTDAEKIAKHILRLTILQTTPQEVSWDGVVINKEIAQNIEVEVD